ncbi:hypothetical protein GCM10008179_08730 [Hansschlegelia plantiphila]|uniref:L,D-TPase catalytic domain-containing protein n=1 Tax=Hansschlegelia plantiphila TaxID=374655 RepID=A0A9W6J0X2_9HYPH|nr:L,D-transpeptidase [Hansschlegelia plantiphila]GLK67235.1 hypothetical protein GCM10008179_08730 [Hansschlegelia plantiphila]
MILVRVAAACCALALGFGVSAATPAAAEPLVIPAPEYVPRERAPRVVERYDDDSRVVRRVYPDERSRYVREMEDDPADWAYRSEDRYGRIPPARDRNRGTVQYDRYGPIDRGGRVYRYYDGPDYDPYDDGDPVMTPAPRRLAGPPSAAGVDQQPMRRTVDPRFARTTVRYAGKEPANSIVIDTSTRYLYLVQGDGTAIRYGVGVGKEGFTWKGTETIVQKKEWPEWRPPAEMRERRPELPVMMAGGPNNPLGARALYLGHTLYRIHGSNEPWTIGHAVSSGCIRMTNEDVMDLYERVGVGTVVKVI